MIPQAAWGIAGVLVLPDGSLMVDEAAVDPDLPLTDAALDGEPFVGLRAFLDAVAGRVAPFKIQLTGPVTLGLALHAVGASRRPGLRRRRQGGGRGRTARCSPRPAGAAPGATPVVFLDEPGLTAALEPGFPSASTTRSTWCPRHWPPIEGQRHRRPALLRAGRLAGRPPGGTADPVAAGRRRGRRPPGRVRRLPRPGRLDGLGRGAHRPPPRRERRDPLAPSHGRVGRARRRRLRPTAPASQQAMITPACGLVGSIAQADRMLELARPLAHDRGRASSRPQRRRLRFRRQWRTRLGPPPGRTLGVRMRRLPRPTLFGPAQAASGCAGPRRIRTPVPGRAASPRGPSTPAAWPTGRSRSKPRRLRAEIPEHNRRYHELDDPTISDADYDELVARAAGARGGVPRARSPPTRRPSRWAAPRVTTCSPRSSTRADDEPRQRVRRGRAAGLGRAAAPAAGRCPGRVRRRAGPTRSATSAS